MGRPRAGSAARPGVVAVAREARVSPATVSNVFNRPDVVSPQLRERVEAAAARLGYGGGDPSARSLRGHRAFALGVVIRERLVYAFDDPAALSVLRGISGVADREQLALVILPAFPEQGGTNGPAVRHAAVDGLILYSLVGDDPLVRAVVQRHLPTVVIDSPHGSDAVALTGQAHGFVGLDDHTAGRQAAEHLLRRGHRRIGIVTSRLSALHHPGPVSPDLIDVSTASVARGRLQGARSALATAGIVWSDVALVQCRTSSRADGAQAGRQLLERWPGLTAVIALSDELAAGVRDTATQLGRDVPQDLSLVGFDNAGAHPWLTTVGQPHEQKGAAAADMLLTWLHTGVPPAEEIRLSSQLIERSSTAPIDPARGGEHDRADEGGR